MTTMAVTPIPDGYGTVTPYLMEKRFKGAVGQQTSS
jgi:hypothetical protein